MTQALRKGERRDQGWQKFAVNGRLVAASHLKLRGDRCAMVLWEQLSLRLIAGTLLPARGERDMFNVTSGVYENTRFSGQVNANPASEDASPKPDFQAVLRQAVNPEKGPEEGNTRSPANQQRLQADASLPIPLVREYEAAPAGSRAQLANWWVHAAYCGPSMPASQALLPDWDAAAGGQTAGGIGNTDGWGKPINWGSPERQMLEAGQTFVTPAGTYQAVTNPHGDLVLRPLDDALRPPGDYLHSMTIGQHHIGIHPKTGEVWYQQVA